MTRLAGLRMASALGLFALGCAGAAVEQSGATGGRLPGRTAGTAIVLQGTEIQGRGQTLLQLLDERVVGMSVNYSGPCPAIQMRGAKSLFGSSDPLIYVDGARALNTCVLDDLSTDVVKRIEVYPSGQAQKPGYDSNRGGLILVFVLDGKES